MTNIVCPDSNVLCHSGPLERIEWGLVFNQEDVTTTVLILPTVLTEMDDHKSAKDKTLRKRATELNTMLKQAERAGYRYELPGTSKITYVFVPYLDFEDGADIPFKPQKNDDKIVLEALYLSRQHTSLAFISNDARAVYLARQVGLKTHRSEEFWGRADEAECEEVVALRKQIETLTSRQPKLVVADMELTRPVFTSISAEFAADFPKARAAIIEDQRLNHHRMSLVWEQLPEREAARYDELYSVSNDALNRFANSSVQDLKEDLERKLMLFELPVKIMNEGSMADEDIYLFVEPASNATLVANEREIWPQLSFITSAKEGSAGSGNYPKLKAPEYADLRNNMRGGPFRRNKNLFHPKLPHGFHCGEVLLAKANHVESKSVFEITVRSKSLIKPLHKHLVVTPVEVELNSNTFADWYLTHASRWPFRERQLYGYFLSDEDFVNEQP